MADDSVALISSPPSAETLADPTEWRAFPAGIALDLATAEPDPGRTHEDLIEPFVPLGRRGRFARTLLARVVGPSGGAVREVALKIQSDDYPVGELSGWSNVDVDEQWQEQYRLWQAAAEAGAAPALVDVLPGAADGGAPLLPPTLYCKRQRAFFTAPCPECGVPLETCRDGALLDRHGLPRYDRSLERFLHCRSCLDAGRAPRFYSLLLSDPGLRARAPVGEQTDLFRDLAGLARRGGRIPCAGCANVPSCYPEGDRSAGEAIRLLTPLSFYEYRCLPLERLHLHYDEFAAVVGGASGAGVERLFDGDGRYPRRYLFEDDPRGKLPLEILRLKLALFAQLVGAVRSLHRATRLPHLALSPENVMVELFPAPAGLPRLYAFRARLLGIGAAHVLRIPGLDSGALPVPLLEPPPIRDSTYAISPIAGAGAVHTGSVRILSVSSAGGAASVIEAELSSDAFDLRTVGPRDALRVTVRQGRPVPISLEWLGTPSRAGTDRVILRSSPVVLESVLAQQLRTVTGEAALRAAFEVYACLHAPTDVQSLGLLLFTTLAANEEQPPARVAAAARELAANLEQLHRERPDAGGESVAELAGRLLQQAESDGVLARSQIFHRPSAERDSRMPMLGAFWQAALLLGLRALTHVPGFGFCRRHDDFDPAHPEGPADHLLADVRILEHDIDADLLGVQGKRRELAEAVARVGERLAPVSRVAERRGG